MWKFEFGHPKTSAVTQTVLATDAQVTAAGLTLDLDVWGGCQKASWAGLTGPQADTSRVWISVADPTAPGGWRRRFSGCLTVRPSGPSGTREALGDKYHRLKWLPVTRQSSRPTTEERALGALPFNTDEDVDSFDLGAAVRKLGREAQADLPHLIVTPAGVPTVGTGVIRDYKGQSIAGALDVLAALQPGWGWTTRPDDTLYLGPPVARVVELSTAQRGVRIALRDVTTEGTINAVRFVYELPGGEEVRYEFPHPSAATAPRACIVRYIDSRSAPAVVEPVPATYVSRNASGDEAVVDYALLRDGDTSYTSVTPVQQELRAVLAEGADWVDVGFRVFPGEPVTLSAPDRTTVYETDEETGLQVVLQLLNVPPDSTVSLSCTGTAGTRSAVTELNPLRLNGTPLQAEANRLYHVPPQHAATISEPGLHEPAGSVVITRRWESTITEAVVTTRLRIQDPPRTEYIVGEPEGSVDAQAVRVIIDRKDRETLNDAAALRTVP
ncbi:hypothetical protein [Deinococcus yunweiensis]|uniref:hypothetical protein n=1 Tax=Deinococcus yunweiensis TaxID=367282 RepID=UPI00398E74A2